MRSEDFGTNCKEIGADFQTQLTLPALQITAFCDLTKILGRCIRVSVDVQQLRQRLGMSRDALARELGVTYKTIYLWEKGKNKPSPMAQQKLEELEKRVK